MSIGKSTYLDDFPRLLRRLRLGRRLTQSKLGALIGEGPNTVGRWERDEGKPNPQQLKKLARTLKVSVDELLGRVRVGGDAAVSLTLDLPGIRDQLMGIVRDIDDALEPESHVDEPT